MSGGLFDWVGEVVAEMGSEIAEAFGFDDAVSSSEATQARTPSENQERGRASYLQGQDLERYTEQQLDEFGLNALWDSSNLVYDETLEDYGKNTQVDVIIRDDNDNEVAIIECKAYTSKWSNDDAVDQAKRLVYLARERGVALIFSTSDGTADCFGSRVKEVLNETQWFVISPDNIFFADPSDVKENGFTQGLPPEFQSHQNTVDSGSGDSGGSWDLFGNWFGDSSDSKSSNSSDSNSSNSDDSGGSWFSGLFGDSSDSESSDSSDSNSSDSDDSGGSWFSGWFGDSSDSESSDSSDSNSSDSDSSYGSDSDSSYGSDSDSSYSSDSDSSYSSDSDSSYSSDSDSSYSSDSDSSYSSDSDSSYSSDSDSSYSSDSDSSYSSDSDSSYSSDSDSSYSSDSGSSDYGSGDSGDSGGSDSSSSSSDSWW
ncbi:hypothetical protein [Microcoleus sp. bin38.metabat.b11b12b14.051]|uniref:hypothetical protein n=1 Tax=Microcoleus sp. bin38.metabat.b11b12b14.051 TaxID=2742709 RepID=UPI0025F2C95A|nr:hypothetical protein [Microcoleus sp. bin38.metabat.b11b12b14.051]